MGCGGATNDRPRIVKSPTLRRTQDCSRGIFASNGVDDLLFQSLEVVDWDSDGIFVAGIPECTAGRGGPGGRIVFRDIIGDGGDQGDLRPRATPCFRVHSADVLIEGCEVRDISDAGIYIGQSDGLVIRYNRIERSVAGIEFENSAHGVGHNNFATGNTAGHLVFLDGSLPVQFSNDHRVAHNVFVDNNGVNYGAGNVAGVPVGTGMLLISDDNSVYEYNIVTGNDSFGIAMTDQVVAEFSISEDLEDIRATGATIREQHDHRERRQPRRRGAHRQRHRDGPRSQLPAGRAALRGPAGSQQLHRRTNLVDQEPRDPRRESVPLRRGGRARPRSPPRPWPRRRGRSPSRSPPRPRTSGCPGRSRSPSRTEFATPDQCTTCHSNYGEPAVEPFRNWQGSMMAQSGRDPLMWAALAIANQDAATRARPACAAICRRAGSRAAPPRRTARS